MKKGLLWSVAIIFIISFITVYARAEIDKRDFDGDGDIDGDDLSVFAEKFGAVIRYKDFDGDLYSDGNTEYSGSQPTDHYYLSSELIAIDGDCDDEDENVNPGMDEICDDGIDNNCDGFLDQQDFACQGDGYSHSIVIDGLVDFDLEKEGFNTSTNGFLAYITWDNDYLFIGFQGPDIELNDPFKWLLIYIGNGDVPGGTTTGFIYNDQIPSLPFAASYHIRWQGSGDFINAQMFNGSSWVNAGWDFTGDAMKNLDFVELRIPLVDIGTPINSLHIHINMVTTNLGGEWSYAAVPYDSFTDSYDPNYTKYFDFNLIYPLPPNNYTSK